MGEILTRKQIILKLQDYVDGKIHIGNLQDWEIKMSDYDCDDWEEDDSLARYVLKSIDMSDIDGFDKDEAKEAIKLLKSGEKSSKAVKKFEKIMTGSIKGSYRKYKNNFTCDCCGYKTIKEKDHSETCPVCFWCDDLTQEKSPDVVGGPNMASLRLAQDNFKEFGASERRFKRYVLPPTNKYPRDYKFNPLPQKQNKLLNNYRKIKYSGSVVDVNEYKKVEGLMCIEAELVALIHSFIHEGYKDFVRSPQYYIEENEKEGCIEDIQELLNRFNLELEKIDKMYSSTEKLEIGKEVLTFFKSVKEWGEEFLNIEDRTRLKNIPLKTKELKNIFKKFHDFKLPDMSEDKVEQEIFADLDLIYSYLFGQLINKKNFPLFDLEYEKNRICRVTRLIKSMGKNKFNKNKGLVNWYDLCLEAIKVMEDYNKNDK